MDTIAFGAGDRKGGWPDAYSYPHQWHVESVIKYMRVKHALHSCTDADALRYLLTLYHLRSHPIDALQKSPAILIESFRL